MNTATFKAFAMIGVGLAMSATALAAPQPAVSCEQIRAQIQAQTGVRDTPDTALLDTLSEHPACRFTAAEVYRAAFGDRPMPSNPRRSDRAGGRDDDD
ncbi:MAG: hypothetical protein DWQ11_07315 [Proteobacteria bacterium]|nr:MAG: hypothetical protein DWQ11_07315 [Pseudomonadota bacterium]